MYKLNIPQSWAECTLNELAEGFQYGLNASAAASGNYKLLRITDLKDDGINWDSVPHVKLAPSEAEKYLLKDKDILVARSGSIGKIAIIKSPPENVVFASYLIRIKLRKEVKSFPIIETYFRSPIFQKHILANAKGAAQTNVNTDALKRSPFAIPSILEQERILEKVEATEEKIKMLESSILKTEELIEKYSESLFQKAFRGKLVGKDANDEPVSELLKRIDSERTKKLKNLKKREELPPVLAESTPFEIPKSWKWVRLGILAEKVEYGTSAKTNDSGEGVPVLRMGNIQNGILDYSKLKFLPKKHSEFPTLFLDDADLIFNRTNSPELVGKCAIFESMDRPYSFASYLIRVSFVKNGVYPKFISYYINSSFGRDWVNSVMVQQVGQANVNGTKLKECLVPLPPREEQRRILNEMEKNLENIENLKVSTNQIKNNLKHMMDSILENAFSGKLVPQVLSEGQGQDILIKIKQSISSNETNPMKKTDTKNNKKKMVKK